MPVVPLEYIEIDDRGVAKLVGSRVKVSDFVATQRADGFTAEQLCDQFPHLEPAQVYAALSYYHAHKAEVDAQIEASIRYADEVRAAHPNPITRDELVARWRARYPDRPIPGEDGTDDI